MESDTFLAAGRDPDEAMQKLSPLYAGSAWWSGATQRPYTYRYTSVGDETLSLRTSRMSGRISGQVPAGGDLVVQWISRGVATIRTGADHLDMQADRPVLFPADRDFIFDYADYDQKLVHLSRREVERVARERNPGMEGPIRFDHGRTPTPASRALWLDTITLIARARQRGDANELLWRELTSLSITAFLQLYPATFGTAARSTAEAGASTRVRLLTEYIDAHAHLPLTATDLANAVGLSLRGLQDAATRHLGMTPMAYLRQVRLDRVRTDLRTAPHGHITVALVARRWGFTHLGRFAADYSRRFGEMPSTTLQQASGRAG